MFQCLAPVYACHGLEVITVEGVGNRHDGYHPIQQKLYEFSGSQCGFCSSGMVVNMYALLESAPGGQVSALDVENSFGGNLCRCTGYRPIMDAFKTLAVCERHHQSPNGSCDSPSSLLDIEDLSMVCRQSCGNAPSRPLVLHFDEDRQWHRVTTVQQIFDIFDKCGTKPYMLVAGNTAHGVYRRGADLQLFIDVNGVPELRGHRLDNAAGNLTLGANVNLTETMEILRVASETAGFEYCSRVRTHIDLIANVPVRNAGTVAGNLSIKNAHHEFPSDMFLVLEAVGAKLTIRQADGNSQMVAVADYMSMDMRKKVMIEVVLPKLPPDTFRFRSYKIMPRAQNAHAYVNAGFLVEFESKSSKVRSIRICFGGINDQFVHATKTESALTGLDLYAADTLKIAVQSLTGELQPDWKLPDADPKFRRNLAVSLFYKFVLSTASESTATVAPNLASGGTVLERPLSSGIQSFDTFKERYPLTEPVRKLEGLMQVSGGALYANDLPQQKDELWAAYVQAGRPHLTIAMIDAKEALVCDVVFDLSYAFSGRYTKLETSYIVVVDVLCPLRKDPITITLLLKFKAYMEIY